jgi:uncharacterized protein YciI
MYVIFLKFGPNRAQASDWMPGHSLWIQQGIDDGTFLMAGSLDEARGGVVLASNMDREALLTRIQKDPFVEHGVVTPEVHAVTPSRMVAGMAELLGRTRAASGAA